MAAKLEYVPPGKSKGREEKVMKKKILAALLAATMALSLAACGGESSETKEKSKPKEKEYIDEEQISDVFTNPEKYKGKYVKLNAQIFNGPDTEDGIAAYQAYYDIVNYSKDFIFGLEDSSFAVNDYVAIDGEITDTFEGENLMGGTITCPVIKAESVTKLTYIEAVAPTTKELVSSASAEQNGLAVSVDKVEFSDIETRVYMTVTNSGTENASFGRYDIRIIQDGKQIQQDTNSTSPYDGGYEELGYDVTPGASTSGILVFPVIDQAKDFQVVVPNIYSDDYNLKFTDFSLDIKVQ